MENIVKKEDIIEHCRQHAEQTEKNLLNPRASFSKDHSRRLPIKEDHRLPYRRDVDRIIHSKAYMRYADKTQVVYLVENDHLTHRGLHVQLVNNFARGIAEMLHLNLDLVEAIALGHDVGHPPFGHEGEGYLSELAEEFGLEPFAHPWQSCRLLSLIEPLNLGLNVYDGFLCHDGGMSSPCLNPRYGKTWEDHEADLLRKLENPEGNIIPATLEGCLVKLCDTMSYLGKDIEDAVNLGIINRDQVPKSFLGNNNKEILNTLAKDLIENSIGKDYIAISDEAFEALKVLRTFNFRHIYLHPKLKVESLKIKRCYRILFETLLHDLENSGKESYMWAHYLHNKDPKYVESQPPARLVVDFISGMTDSYFINTCQKLIIPSRIEIS